MQLRYAILFEKQAELCALMASPKRLMIMDLLSRQGEVSVGEIATEIDMAVTAVSQHLRLMRDKNVVLARKEGHTVYYRLKHPRLMDGCHALRQVLLDELRDSGEIAESLTAGGSRRKTTARTSGRPK